MPVLVFAPLDEFPVVVDELVFVLIAPLLVVELDVPELVLVLVPA